LRSNLSFTSIAGTVESIVGNIVYVNTGSWLIALHTDDQTEICKGKSSHGVSALQVGDDILAKCRNDNARNLMAIEIRADIKTLTA
jgi:hypothetical protein